MNNSNSRKPSQKNGDDPAPKESHGVLKRVAWSVACIVLGAGLGWVLPEISAVILMLLVDFGSSSSQDLSGLAIIELIAAACALAAFVGAIAGAMRPGMKSILITLVCLLASDILSLGACLFLFYGGKRFLLIFIVSAIIKSLMIFGLVRLQMASKTDPQEK